MEQGLLIIVAILAIYWFMSKAQEGLAIVPQRVVKRPRYERMGQAARNAARRRADNSLGFKRESAALSRDAMGTRRYSGAREGFSAGQLMSSVYGVSPDADGTYSGYDPSSDFGGCDAVDTNGSANADANDYQEYVHTGQLAYGADVIRNHNKWVSEVAPWSQTAAISPDDLSIDEMRASELQGIAAWTRPAPEITDGAWQVPEQTQNEIDAPAAASGGVLNSGPGVDV